MFAYIKFVVIYLENLLHIFILTKLSSGNSGAKPFSWSIKDAISVNVFFPEHVRNTNARNKKPETPLWR